MRVIIYETPLPELHFVRFTENTPTSIGAAFEDTEGLFRARIYQEGGKFFANCDGMLRSIDGSIECSTSLSGLVWEFDLWLHCIFEGAVLTRTRVKWPALEREYWKYLKKHQPKDFAGFRAQYRRVCEE
jgi:hypothetical protein